MNKSVEKLYLDMSSFGIDLDYEVLFIWTREEKQQLVMNAIKSDRLSEHEWGEAKRIYYTLQAFYFAFDKQGLETVTLDTLIYPTWAHLLSPYLKDFDEFNMEMLGFILDDSHANAILESFRELCEEYAPKAEPEVPTEFEYASLEGAKMSSNGLLFGLKRDFSHSPHAKEQIIKEKHGHRKPNEYSR